MMTTKLQKQSEYTGSADSVFQFYSVGDGFEYWQVHRPHNEDFGDNALRFIKFYRDCFLHTPCNTLFNELSYHSAGGGHLHEGRERQRLRQIGQK
jgi:hypothetical protein